MMLNRAILIASIAHDKQTDKGGQPYILHPLRAMLTMATEQERIVAVLHDVIEDTEITMKYLKERDFPKDVTDALDSLTRRPDETYWNYIKRVERNPLALKVKLADLRDNMDRSRIPNPTDVDQKRWEKYEQAYQYLMSVTEQ